MPRDFNLAQVKMVHNVVLPMSICTLDFLWPFVLELGLRGTKVGHSPP